MRVLLVNKFSRVTGGADRLYLDLAHWLAGRGHQVRVLSTSSALNEEVEGVFLPSSVTSENRDGLSGGAALQVARDAIWNRRAYRATRALVESFRPQVVHVFKLYPQLSVAPVVAAHRAGLPIVQAAVDYEFVSANQFDVAASHRDRDETKYSYRRLNEALHLIRRKHHIPRLTRIVACSRFMAETYARSGLDTQVVPNPVKRYDGKVRRWSERSGVVFAARLHVTKGVLDVLEAARETPDIAYTVVGGGPLEPEVLQAVGRLPNLSHVGWLDLPSLREILAGARVVLTPSKWEEPGALTALEAMATGTPVVTYRSGGLTEFVDDARAGLVVEGNPRALAAAVRRLDERPAEWESFSCGGLAAARGVHSPDTYVARHEEIYGELAAPPRTRPPRRRVSAGPVPRSTRGNGAAAQTTSSSRSAAPTSS